MQWPFFVECLRVSQKDTMEGSLWKEALGRNGKERTWTGIRAETRAVAQGSGDEKGNGNQGRSGHERG